MDPAAPRCSPPTPHPPPPHGTSASSRPARPLWPRLCRADRSRTGLPAFLSLQKSPSYPPSTRTRSKTAPAPKLPPRPGLSSPKRPSRCEPSTLGEPGARELRRRPAATRRRLSRRTPRRPRAGKILPSESPGFPAASSHRGLFTLGPDLGLTGSRLACQSDTLSSEWPTDQSPCAGILFGSSALRPFGSPAFPVARPSRAFRRARKLSSSWFNFPFFLRHFRVLRRSGSRRVPEAWVIQVLLGEAKLPRECLRESYVERGRFADS